MTEANPALWLLKAKDFELEQIDPTTVTRFTPASLDPNNLLHQQYKTIVDAYKTTLLAPIELQSDRRKYLQGLEKFNLNAWIRQGANNPALKPLIEVEKALQLFQNMPTARLERLFTEHLDLCSYRLDAWMLGLVHQRLEKQRAKKPQGIQIGAFGYLLGLKAKEQRDVVVLHVEPNYIPATQDNFDRAAIPIVDTRAAKKANIDLLQSTEKAFFYLGKDNVSNLRLRVAANRVEANNAANNDGFIHTPSLAHANTAAILRAGFLAHQTDTNTKAMSINLSPARVRQALQLIEGMQTGVSLAEFLGHLFERRLHDAQLDARLGVLCVDGVWESFEPIDAGDQNVLHPARL